MTDHESMACSGNTNRTLQDLMDAAEHVYFIYSAGMVKIGYSKNWLSRVDRVCDGCPHPAELILVMPGDREYERSLHELFAESRQDGEWFDLEGNVRRFLDHYATLEGRETLAWAHDLYLLGRAA